MRGLKKWENEFNNIISMGLLSYPFFTSKVTKDEQKWAYNRIQELAKGLFLDGKKVIVSKSGGYSGCPEIMIDSFKLNDHLITNIKFCHGCIDGHKYDYFIKFFNRKMYELLNIKPPGIGTILFDGEFMNKKKKSDFKKLILNQDRSFQLIKIINYQEKVYSGYWENDKFNLTLDLSKYDDIEDIKLKYNVNRRKITGINKPNIKFKKVIGD